MGHKPVAIMILPLALAGILMLAVLTTIPSFAQESNNTGIATASQSNDTQQQSSTNGNTQESNNTGNALRLSRVAILEIHRRQPL